MKKKVLFCEDEESIRELITFNLERAGYEVIAVPTGEEAITAYDDSKVEILVAILDITLPGIDGFEVLKELRKRSELMGIIMLSAKSQEMDKVRGFMLGADDYITKPFSPSELLARVDAIYRKINALTSQKNAYNKDEIISDPFILNIKSHTLKKRDHYIDLTQVEFQIVEILMSTPRELVTREDILQKVWGEGYDDKIVDVNVRRIRMKIEDFPSKPEYLVTVWGKGYSWKKPE